MKHRYVVHALAIFLAATGVARAVAATRETQAAPSGKAAEAQNAEVDPQHFLLTGTALHEDGSPWEGLEVVLFPRDKKSGKNRVGYGLNPETGHVELGNPNAKTDAAGRLAIKAPRGQVELIEMGKKGSKEPLVLKIKKDVEKLDLGEIW